jgi:hypothetical protein
MSDLKWLSRLPPRAPPDTPGRLGGLRNSLVRSLFADLLGGEAGETTRYASSLPPKYRAPAERRRDERASAVHRLMLDALFWSRLVIAAVAMAIVVGLFLVVRLLAHENWPSADIGFLSAATTAVSTLGVRRWKRRDRKSGDQD